MRANAGGAKCRGLGNWSILTVGWLISAIAASLVCLSQHVSGSEGAEFGYLAPIAVRSLVADHQVVVLGSHGRCVLVVDTQSDRVIRSTVLPGRGTDMIVRGDTAIVALGEPDGQVLWIDLQSGVTLRRLSVGHTPSALALSSDGNILCVANRFDNQVEIIDLSTVHQHVVQVIREPVAMTLSLDEKLLFVANHLPEVRPFLDDENPLIAAEVSVIAVETGSLVKQIELPNGSQSLRAMALSPDGQYVAVTHILSNYTVPTLRIAAGTMNRNAISLIRARELDLHSTVILDDPDRGAANPWAVAFSNDGSQLFVTHAGTHELSVIDFGKLLQRLEQLEPALRLFDPANLTHMTGLRRRISVGVNGVRSLLIRDGDAVVAGYYSDDLAIVNLAGETDSNRLIQLTEDIQQPLERLGEQYFHDASLCWQQWQSCSTCHPDARSDALYWDLLNDAVGNTKNTKSLLMSPLTPPVMWRGVRADAATAIRAGIHHIQFAQPLQKQAEAIEHYLRHLRTVPSPCRNARQLESPKTEAASCAKCHMPGVPRGELSLAARRGKAIFEGKGGCAECHPHPTFTNQQRLDPGLGTGVLYDVPSLVEVWRTAPYLHNGEALTLREAITDFNFMQRRGNTHSLTEQELNDLLEYLESL